MPVVENHSANFPHEFEVCGGCGKRMVYQLGPGLTGNYPNQEVFVGVRCKACKLQKFMAREQWLGLKMEAQLLPFPMSR